MDAAAADALTAGGPAGMSWGDFGIAGLVIGALFLVICKFVNMWFKASQERERRDAEARSKMYESFNILSDALNRNSEVADRHTRAIVDMTVAVGRLPCSRRDPTLRTRASDDEYAEAVVAAR